MELSIGLVFGNFQLTLLFLYFQELLKAVIVPHNTGVKQHFGRYGVVRNNNSFDSMRT